MKKTLLLLAEGFEEVEALTVVDLLRRADIVCDMAALGDDLEVTGSHGITVRADRLLPAAESGAYDGVILPGGLRGTENLAADGRVAELLRRYRDEGKLTAAICAAPTVLAAAGLLEGKRAVCYPGMEPQLCGADAGGEEVAVDGSVITSRGLGTAIPFALALVAYLDSPERAQALAKAIVFRQ